MVSPQPWELGGFKATAFGEDEAKGGRHGSSGQAGPVSSEREDLAQVDTDTFIGMIMTCMYVHIHTYIHIYIYICIYIYLNLHVYIYIHTYIYITRCIHTFCNCNWQMYCDIVHLTCARVTLLRHGQEPSLIICKDMFKAARSLDVSWKMPGGREGQAKDGRHDWS